MTKNLLLILPFTLVSLILYTSFSTQVMENIQHLFFLSATTMIVYSYLVSQNPHFTFIRKLKWYLLLFIIPSVFAIAYWIKYINIAEEE